MGLKNISLAGTVTVGQKGQIVIPVELREKMSIVPGDKLVTLYLEDKNAIGFITERSAQDLVEKMGEHIFALESALQSTGDTPRAA